MREGQADEAEMMRRQVLAMWPGQTDATYLLLMAYTFGNLDLAIAHVREACQSPRARGSFGRARPSLRRARRPIGSAEFRRAARSKPESGISDGASAIHERLLNPRVP